MHGFVVRCYTKGTAKSLLGFLLSRGIIKNCMVDKTIDKMVNPILIGVNKNRNLCFSHDGYYMDKKECRKDWRCYEFANTIFETLEKKEGDLLRE